MQLIKKLAMPHRGDILCVACSSNYILISTSGRNLFILQANDLTVLTQMDLIGEVTYMDINSQEVAICAYQITNP